MKRALIIALAAILVVMGSHFAYTYTTATRTLNIAQPPGDIVTSNASAAQPDWNSILDDLSSENKTCGAVPSGDLFDLTPNSEYSGGAVATLYLTNTGNLTKAYSYLNMKAYIYGSEEAEGTPNYRLLTLKNGRVIFTIADIIPTLGTWTQTSQADFQGGTANQTDTATSPGNVILDRFSDNVSDDYDDQTKIADSANVTVSGSQVKLTFSSGVSDNETFMPNAAGDDTNIDTQFPISGAHWDKVDEATADNFTTYVSTNSVSYQRDLYNIPDSTDTGVIDNVILYFRLANSASTADSNKYAVAYEGDLDDGFLKTVEIASSGQITDTVIDTLEFDPDGIAQPDLIHVSGNISAIAYEGNGGDGFLKTVEIASSGNITDTVIDTLEFDTLDGHEVDIIHVSGDIFAIAYRGNGGDGFLKTVEIASSGQITDTVIDTLEFDTGDGDSPDTVHVSGDIFAIAYTGSGTDGYVTTVEIASNGQITDTVVDTLEFDTSSGQTPSIINTQGDIYAIAYDGKLGDGYVTTVEIASSGQITDTVVDTLEFDTLDGHTPNIILVSENITAIAYDGVTGDGFLKTVEILSNGQITDPVVDTLEFDTLDGHIPVLINISDDIFAIAYEGDASDGYLKTVEIASNGQITDTVVDTLEFDISSGFTPSVVFLPHVPGNVYGKAAIKTHGTVYTGSEESTNSDTFVLKSYQWTNNPNTSSAWTWAEVDALQAGVELRTYYEVDESVCTQIYVIVNYTAGTYDSPGTITSTNLLSAETVGSIDALEYNSSNIPAGTGLKVQFSQDNINWYNSSGTLNGWNTLSQGTANISLSSLGWSGANFYYQMEFTSDGNDTPILEAINTFFSTFYASGDLTSSDYDTEYDVEWGTISFTISEPSTTNIQFQLRSAATQGGLSSATWYGPTSTSDYYQTSGTAINSVHDGDRWIQYWAYFSGPGDFTPTLSDISIYYSGTQITFVTEVIGGGYCLVSDNTSDWETGWTVTPEFYVEVAQK
ncbi:hypothetical protein ACFLTG_03505 [Chloroflexota bacterium]